MIGIKDQYFGTEIEMTGITRQRAAEVVAEMFGTEAYYDGTTYDARHQDGGDAEGGCGENRHPFGRVHVPDSCTGR